MSIATILSNFSRNISANAITSSISGGVQRASNSGALGQFASAYSTYNLSRASGAILGANVKIAKQNAKQIIEWGDYKARKQEDQTHRLIASQRAGFGAAGFVPNSRVIDETIEQGFMEAIAIRKAAELQAHEQKNQALMLDMQRKIGEYSARASVISSFAGGLTSLMTG